jgi:hypothetical protein
MPIAFSALHTNIHSLAKIRSFHSCPCEHHCRSPLPFNPPSSGPSFPAPRLPTPAPIPAGLIFVVAFHCSRTACVPGPGLASPKHTALVASRRLQSHLDHAVLSWFSTFLPTHLPRLVPLALFLPPVPSFPWVGFLRSSFPHARYCLQRKSNFASSSRPFPAKRSLGRHTESKPTTCPFSTPLL